MAKETKVGVLTGLAFIICFAVVLANRGTNLTVPTVNHYNSRLGGDTSATQPGHTNSIPEVVPVHYVQQNGTDRGSNPGRNVPTPSGDRMAAVPPSNDQTLGLNQIQTAIKQGHLIQQPIQNAVQPSAEPSRPVQEATLTAQYPSTAPVFNQPQQLPQSGNGGVQPDVVKHVVAPGETLWSVASRVYGRKSASLVKAIYEANRSVMTSPDSVKAGMELVVPRVVGAEMQSAAPQTLAAAPTTSTKKTPTKSEKPDNGNEKSKSTKPARDTRVADASTSKTSDKSSGDDTRWYQVRKNDGLMDIAREQLGDAGRWEEIYKMNKDKFADPAKIREGVRIKLPAAKGKSRGGA